MIRSFKDLDKLNIIQVLDVLLYKISSDEDYEIIPAHLRFYLESIKKMADGKSAPTDYIAPIWYKEYLESEKLPF